MTRFLAQVALRDMVKRRKFVIYSFMGKASRSKNGSDKKLRIPENRSSEFSGNLNKKGLLQKTVVHMLLIISLGFLAYSNTFHSPFQWDDIKHVIGNPVIKDLDNFTASTKGYEFNPRRFVGYLTFALNYHFGGSGMIGYHAVNLLIHLINAILVYFLVIMTFRTPYFISEKVEVRGEEAGTGNKKSEVSNGTVDGLSVRHSPFIIQNSHLVALFSALLFVLHPIQTQAVTYVVQRFASLATLFYLSSLLMYIKGRLTMEKTGDDMQKPTELSASTLPLSITFYSLSLVYAALAMMTKEIAFTLPVMIVLYEVAFFRSSLRRRLLFLIPIALILIIVFIGVFVSDKSLEDMLSDASEIARVQTHMSRWDYLNTQMRVITTYIRLIFLPVNQNFDYDYPIEHSFFTLPVFFSFLFLLALFGLALYLFSRSRFIAFGILWFFITLSVESSIIPIIDVIFEHRVYLPSIGLLTGITTGVFIVSHRLKMERIGLSVLVLVVLILSGATYARNKVWMSKVSLWEDVVSKSPDKARPRNNLGVFYYEAGYLDKAGREFQAALKINPGYPDAHYNLGNIHLASGRIDEALREFQTAVKLKPDYADAHNNLGTLYARRGNFEEALREFQTALQIDAKNPARKNLEKLLEMQQTKGGAP